PNRQKNTPPRSRSAASSTLRRALVASSNHTVCSTLASSRYTNHDDPLTASRCTSTLFSAASRSAWGTVSASTSLPPQSYPYNGTPSTTRSDGICVTAHRNTESTQSSGATGPGDECGACQSYAMTRTWSAASPIAS